MSAPEGSQERCVSTADFRGLYSVSVTKNVESKGGVVLYKTVHEFKATFGDLILAGIADAALYVGLDGHVPCEPQQADGAPVASLLAAFKSNPNFARQFREVHPRTFVKHKFRKGESVFYAPSMAVEDSEGGVQAGMSWATNYDSLAPDHFRVTAEDNIARALGSIPGLTVPYGYIGAMNHFFDVHFEEGFIGAVNLKVLPKGPGGQPGCGPHPLAFTAPQQIQSKLSRLDPELADERRFWATVQRVAEQLQLTDSVPASVLDLFNAIGYKMWYIFEGTNDELLALVQHIRNELGINPEYAPGLAVLQHYGCTPGARGNISLNVEELPERLRRAFRPTQQAGSDVVSTETMLHCGFGICSINIAYNFLPSDMLQRPQPSAHHHILNASSPGTPVGGSGSGHTATAACGAEDESMVTMDTSTDGGEPAAGGDVVDGTGADAGPMAAAPMDCCDESERPTTTATTTLFDDISFANPLGAWSIAADMAREEARKSWKAHRDTVSSTLVSVFRQADCGLSDLTPPPPASLSAAVAAAMEAMRRVERRAAAPLLANVTRIDRTCLHAMSDDRLIQFWSQRFLCTRCGGPVVDRGFSKYADIRCMWLCSQCAAQIDGGRRCRWYSATQEALERDFADPTCKPSRARVSRPSRPCKRGRASDDDSGDGSGEPVKETRLATHRSPPASSSASGSPGASHGGGGVHNAPQRREPEAVPVPPQTPPQPRGACAASGHAAAAAAGPGAAPTQTQLQATATAALHPCVAARVDVAQPPPVCASASGAAALGAAPAGRPQPCASPSAHAAAAQQQQQQPPEEGTQHSLQLPQPPTARKETPQCSTAAAQLPLRVPQARVDGARGSGLPAAPLLLLPPPPATVTPPMPGDLMASAAARSVEAPAGATTTVALAARAQVATGVSDAAAAGHVATGVTDEAVPGQVATGVTDEAVPGQVATGVTDEAVPGQVATGVSDEAAAAQVATGFTDEAVPGRVATGVTDEAVPEQVATGVTDEAVPGQVATGVSDAAAAATVATGVATGVSDEAVPGQVVTGVTDEAVPGRVATGVSDAAAAATVATGFTDEAVPGRVATGVSVEAMPPHVVAAAQLVQLGGGSCGVRTDAEATCAPVGQRPERECGGMLCCHSA